MRNKVSPLPQCKLMAIHSRSSAPAPSAALVLHDPCRPFSLTIMLSVCLEGGLRET